MSAAPSYYFRLLLISIAGVVFLPSTFALGEEVNDEVSEEVRVDSAWEKLSANASIVVLYAGGLCCPSCAIGVRKKVSRLPFVDRKRFNKGVDLDAKTQLVSVAVTPSDDDPDFDSLSQAIWDAGYTPVRSYALVGGKLVTTALPSEARN